MPLLIPNEQDVPASFAYVAMAVRDRTDDFAARCDSLGSGVLSGMSVGPDTGTDMKVAVSSGSVLIAGRQYLYSGSGSPLTIGPASTGDRRDVIIYRAGSGSGVMVLAGTPSAFTTGNWTTASYPVLPPVKTYLTEATDVVLAEIYICSSNGSNTVAITSANIVDKRNTLGSATAEAYPASSLYLAGNYR
jgi:hypothetical protein